MRLVNLERAREQGAYHIYHVDDVPYIFAYGPKNRVGELLAKWLLIFERRFPLSVRYEDIPYNLLMVSMTVHKDTIDDFVAAARELEFMWISCGVEQKYPKVCPTTDSEPLSAAIV